MCMMLYSNDFQEKKEDNRMFPCHYLFPFASPHELEMVCALIANAVISMWHEGGPCSGLFAGLSANWYADNEVIVLQH